MCVHLFWRGVDCVSAYAILVNRMESFYGPRSISAVFAAAA